MTNAVHLPRPMAVSHPSGLPDYLASPIYWKLNPWPTFEPSYWTGGQPPYTNFKNVMSYKSQLTPDTPIPISLTAVLIVPLILYLLYLRFSTRQQLRLLNRNQHTQIQTQREQYENEAGELHQQIQQLDEHINLLRTEQILREKQNIQLRNRLEQREKLLDRFTAELLPVALNTAELSATARNLQQACRTAELSARFDNKQLQRLPPPSSVRSPNYIPN